MKKTRSLLVSPFNWLLVGALALAACGPAATTAAPDTQVPAATEAVTEAPTEAATTAATEAATTAPQTTAAPEKPIAVEDGATIVFSGWGDETEQKIYRDSITRFNALYPNVKVDYQPIPTDFQTKLKAAMAGGTAPDVFYVDDQLMAAFGPTNQLLPLDDYMSEAGVSQNDYIPSLFQIFSANGKTYALPKDWGTLGLVYLPEAFTDAGVAEPTDSWTMDDLKTAAEAINTKGTYAAFCQNADWARFAPFVFANGGAFASDDLTTATIDTSAVKEAAQYILDLKDGGALKTASDLGASWCGEAIGKKLAAMTFEGGWMVNFMRQSYADVQWNVASLPAGSQGKADIIFTNGIGVNAATKFPKASAALALFITGRQNEAEIEKTGFAYSPHPDQLSAIVDPNDKTISQGSTFPLTRVAYWGPNTGKVNDAVTKALESIYLGDMTVDEAFAQAQTVVQTALTASN